MFYAKKLKTNYKQGMYRYGVQYLVKLIFNINFCSFVFCLENSPYLFKKLGLMFKNFFL